MKIRPTPLLLLLLLLPSCGGGTPHAGRSHVTTSPSAPASSLTGVASGAPGSPAPASRAASPGAGEPAPASPPTSATTRSASPAPTASLPHDVSVRASVQPHCVRPGGTVRLTVHSQPEAAVAYGARYADGGYGAAPPVGKGYGGSGHGTADRGGGWDTTWTVAPNAPRGAATVDVFAGWRGKAGSTTATFVVGDC